MSTPTARELVVTHGLPYALGMADAAPATPCWVLPDSKSMWDERHVDTHETAVADLADVTDPDHGRDSEVAQRPSPCLLAVAACGYTYDEDGEGVEHFATQADLAANVISAGWTDGGPRGWLCAADSSCECPR